jgi:hypothetical protein
MQQELLHVINFLTAEPIFPGDRRGILRRGVLLND